MLCVTDITVIEVDSVDFTLALVNKDDLCRVAGEHEQYMPVTFVEDHIRGMRFINRNNKEVCIGWSSKVQTALGVPFEALTDMSTHIGRQSEVITAYEKRIIELCRMDWRKWLRILFTGKV